MQTNFIHFVFELTFLLLFLNCQLQRWLWWLHLLSYNLSLHFDFMSCISASLTQHFKTFKECYRQASVSTVILCSTWWSGVSSSASLGRIFYLDYIILLAEPWSCTIDRFSDTEFIPSTGNWPESNWHLLVCNWSWWSMDYVWNWKYIVLPWVPVVMQPLFHFCSNHTAENWNLHILTLEVWKSCV